MAASVQRPSSELSSSELSDDDNVIPVEWVRFTSLVDFIADVQRDYDVRRIRMQVEEDGELIEVGFFIRITADGERLTVPIPNIPMDRPMKAETLARLCRGLRIPPHRFNLLG